MIKKNALIYFILMSMCCVYGAENKDKSDQLARDRKERPVIIKRPDNDIELLKKYNSRSGAMFLNQIYMFEELERREKKEREEG